ncbi:hypothetical protein, partial [Candidatus Amarolinea dominans]|uniref:hypothetical protein n=1 Tax=Candidatus Amarolinea dominans TaxID=3140696 RepID=UPI0031CCBDB6
EIVYDLAVTILAIGAAAGVTISDTLPAGFGYVSFSSLDRRHPDRQHAAQPGLDAATLPGGRGRHHRPGQLSPHGHGSDLPRWKSPRRLRATRRATTAVAGKPRSAVNER